MNISLKEKLTALHNSTELSHICLGLDPCESWFNPWLQAFLAQEGIKKFLVRWSCEMIDGSFENTRTVKFQSAYYESYGSQGIEALRESCGYARRKGCFTILDAKRCDISSTMAAYGRFAFDWVGADALTVVPYMGTDVLQALSPWLHKGHGAYIVWLTSNVPGYQFQSTMVLDGKPLYEMFFLELESFATKNQLQDAIGFVLGATNFNSSIAEFLKNKNYPFLMPGLGAQGGSLTSDLRAFVKTHAGTLLPISRGLTSLSGQDVSNFDSYKEIVAERLESFR